MLSWQVVLALAVSCGAQLVVPTSYVYPWTQYSTADAFGGAGFGYYSFDQNRQETRLADGRVVGQFSYIDANGKPVISVYEAGPQGFKVQSNILPEAPTADLAAPVSNLVAPDYTPEVAQARAEFKAAFDEAAARAVETPAAPEDSAVVPARRRRSAEAEAIQVPLPYLHPVATVVDHKFETKELEKVDAATPAATTKLEVVTKEHTYKIPTYQFQQPIVNIKPVTYTGVAPSLSPIMYTAATGKPITTPFQPLVYKAGESATPILYPYYNPFVIPATATAAEEA